MMGCEAEVSDTTASCTGDTIISFAITYYVDYYVFLLSAVFFGQGGGKRKKRADIWIY
jgi:hypothetical protein